MRADAASGIGPGMASPGIEIPGYPRSPLPGAKSRMGRSSVARDFNPGRAAGTTLESKGKR